MSGKSVKEQKRQVRHSPAPAPPTNTPSGVNSTQAYELRADCIKYCYINGEAQAPGQTNWNPFKKIAESSEANLTLNQCILSIRAFQATNYKNVCPKVLSGNYLAPHSISYYCGVTWNTTQVSSVHQSLVNCKYPEHDNVPLQD